MSHPRGFRLFPVLPALALLLACGFDPEGDSAMAPPPVYRRWWAETEACSGRSGDFERIRWVEVAGHGFDCPGGRCVGHWESSHIIFLAADWKMHEMVVRHEMLHELIGHPGHPDPPFGKGCRLTWNTWGDD